MSRSRSRLAADWFAKLRVNNATQAVEHTDVEAVDTATTAAIANIDMTAKADVTYVDTAIANIPPSNNASALTTGTLPDGRFPAILPAVSGANLTGLVTDPTMGGDLSGTASNAQIIANAVTDTELNSAKLNGIEAGATADQTGAEILALFSNSITAGHIANNAVTDAKIAGMSSSKLSGALPAIDGSALTGLSAGGATMQVFTSSGTWNWAASGSPSTVYALVIGGGGGGGGGAGNANSSWSMYSGGGGGGGNTKVWQSVSVSGNVSVTVGSGGSGGTQGSGNATAGGTGGTSTFSTVSAGGGGGGARGYISTFPAGGTGNGTGANGERGGTHSNGTAGGGAFMGGSGTVRGGGTAKGYGAGGSGGKGPSNGGAGKSGIVILAW